MAQSKDNGTGKMTNLQGEDEAKEAQMRNEIDGEIEQGREDRISPGEASAEQTVDDLMAAGETIAKLEQEIAGLKDQMLRALAEAENTRRRARKESEDTAKYAVANMARDFLSIPDNLHRVLESIPAEGRTSSELLEKLAAGVELVEREAQTILERHGIKRIDPLGQPFDHNFHQALFEVPTTDRPAGTVVQVLAPGYVIHDRLLRPALVGVAKVPAGGAKDDPGDDSAARIDTTV
ncbi:MAG TPA: nucleotide exchange factor GrpE [Alphaproteobacteria bacterium]|nr:nucleotide exchange factor GrpE [Alphaproteobacteria bacterium]